MSRVTLYRIEQGEPSVAMGAYMSAIAALGRIASAVQSRDLIDLAMLNPPRKLLAEVHASPCK